MSILENLLAALQENTAALNAVAAAGGAKSEVASTTTAAAGKGKAVKPAVTKPEAPKHTVEDVNAAAVAVKEKFGSPAASELIKTIGKADKLKEIKPENYDAFVAACATKVEAEEEQTADDEL